MKHVLLILSFLIGTGTSLAQREESVDHINTSKTAQKAPGKDATTPAGEVAGNAENEPLTFDTSREALNPIVTPAPAGNSIVPSGVSLTEFLEYGMVPVEDLEAELAAPPKNPGFMPNSPKGKYYTVYSRVISTGSSGTGSTPVSIDTIEISDEDDDEDDDDDDEDEDDNPEETHL